MKGDLHQEEAIVLRLTEYGDNDYIVGLLTEHEGKMTAFAAGARKSKKRFSALDLFVQGRAQISPSRSSSGMWRLNFLDPTELNLGLRKSLTNLAAVSYLSECLWAMVSEGNAEKNVFSWWQNILKEFSGDPVEPARQVQLQLELLAMTGYAPSWEVCVECRKTPTGSPLFFSYEKGGVMCKPCRKQDDGRWLEQNLVMRLVAGEALAQAQMGQIRLLLDSFIEYVLGWEPKSLKFRNEVFGFV